MLRVDGLRAAHEGTEVLHGVDLHVLDGEVVALVGSNGAGKTTLLRTVSGLLAPTHGVIEVAGHSVVGMRAFELARRGIRFVPAERRLFRGLSVADNLALGAYPDVPGKDRYAEVFALFPRLAARRSQPVGTMSGGEQQMVAIGRVLMSAPRILLLDEPTSGLAPGLAQEVYRVIRRLRDETGLTVLLAEQQLHLAFQLADRAYVLADGAVELEGSTATLRKDPAVQQTYLGLG